MRRVLRTACIRKPNRHPWLGHSRAGNSITQSCMLWLTQAGALRALGSGPRADRAVRDDWEGTPFSSTYWKKEGALFGNAARKGAGKYGKIIRELRFLNQQTRLIAAQVSLHSVHLPIRVAFLNVPANSRRPTSTRGSSRSCLLRSSMSPLR